MSTTARDEARDEYVASTGWTTDVIADAYDAGFDAGRASVLSALTDMWLLKRRSHGRLADAAARAVLALIEQETTK